MRIFTLLTFLIFLAAAMMADLVMAGTCTTISRTNVGPLSVLTSAIYNADLNATYTAVNNFDGGCTTTGTLELDALNTSDFEPLLKGIREGCKVGYSNASTVTISKCLASVNGNFVTTTASTSASFGCAGCSAEVATTSYYVYIQTGSTGSTLTPLILAGAPNDDGYDGAGNKVLGRFYNNTSSDIAQYSIDQWKVTGFGTDVVKSPGSSNGKPVTCSAYIGSSGVVSRQLGGCIASVSAYSSGETVTFTSGYWVEAPYCQVTPAASLVDVAVITGVPTTAAMGVSSGFWNSSQLNVFRSHFIACHGVAP